MRYSSNADLPESISALLPEHAKTMFREMFNYALIERLDEERAIRAAWSAISRRYVKRPDGYWTERCDWL